MVIVSVILDIMTVFVLKAAFLDFMGVIVCLNAIVLSIKLVITFLESVRTTVTPGGLVLNVIKVSTIGTR